MIKTIAARRAATKSTTMSYTKSIFHIVLRTYRSKPWINELHERELYGYIHGYCKGVNAVLIRIGGMPDHIHILVSMSPTISLAEFVRRLKNSMTVWAKAHLNEFPLFCGWGEGYGAFSYSRFDIDKIKRYIIKQKEHHRMVPFADEYRQWLIENGAEIDEKYFMVDP